MEREGGEVGLWVVGCGFVGSYQKNRLSIRFFIKNRDVCIGRIGDTPYRLPLQQWVYRRYEVAGIHELCGSLKDDTKPKKSS